MMYESNEELLRDGECPSHNCIGIEGHSGPHLPGSGQREGAPMSEVRRLLERLLAAHELAGTYDARRKELATVSRDARAYLAQPITECEQPVTGLAEEEQKQARWHRQDEEHPELCHSNCEGGWPCFTARTIRSLAESRAREGELVAALEPLLQSFDPWCRLDNHRVCQSHLNDKPCSVARARRIFKDILLNTPAALAQGKKE